MNYFWDACYAVGLTNSPSLASVPIFGNDCQRDLYQCYEVSPETIAHGSFGSIRRVTPITTTTTLASDSKKVSAKNQSFACKTVPKSALSDRELLRREVYNLNRCQSDHGPDPQGKNNNILRLVDVLEDRYSVHIVMELCQGGELYDYVVKEHNRTGRGLRGKPLSPSSVHGDPADDELRCATIVFQILTAIRFLHEDACVCHRDLKPSNFIFVHTPSFLPRSMSLRLIDFGLSKYIGSNPDDSISTPREDTEGEKIDENGKTCHEEDSDLYSRDYRYMTSEVGTPYYVAPEVLTEQLKRKDNDSNSVSIADELQTTKAKRTSRRGYTKACDIWSIGVLTFLVLTGELPIMGIDETDTIEKLLDPNLEVDFSDDTLWDHELPSNDERVGGANIHRTVENKKISHSALQFCRSLLQRDPAKRPTASEALRHDWIVTHCGAPIRTETNTVGSRNPSPLRLPSLSAQ